MQAAHARNVQNILTEGGIPPLRFPKLAPYAENLKGNWFPVTTDARTPLIWQLTNPSGGLYKIPPRDLHAYIEHITQQEAARLGMLPAQHQASVWIAGGNELGRPSPRSFLDAFNERLGYTANALGVPQDEVLKRFVRGDASLLAIPALSLGAMKANESSAGGDDEVNAD